MLRHMISSMPTAGMHHVTGRLKEHLVSLNMGAALHCSTNCCLSDFSRGGPLATASASSFCPADAQV